MGIVNRDKVFAGYNGNLEHVVVYATGGIVLKADFANGSLVTLGAVMPEKGREVRKAIETGADEAGEILLVHAPELMYDETKKLDAFVIEEGKVARAFYLAEGDIYTYTEDLLPVGVKVGDQLVAGAEGKFVIDTLKASTAKIKFEVIEDSGFELHITKKAFAIQAHRA